MIELDKRLSMTASLVNKNRRLADIGTDHAYLPCYLAEKNIISEAVAADIAEGPLKNAKKTVRKFGLSDKIDCRLSDGLSNLKPQECEEIVIAGMGGNLIADILANTPWIKNSDIHLILQPMTHSEDVRFFLCRNGFTIDTETAIEDKEKVYIAISAYYTGENCNTDPFFKYFGKLIDAKNGASDKYITKQKNRLTKKLKGYSISHSDNIAEDELRNVLSDERLNGY